MPTETVTLSEEMILIVHNEIESGRFGNAAEVVGAALRALQLEEEEYNKKMCALRAAIEEGFNSGVAEGGTDEVFARVRARAGLPAATRI